MKKVYSSEKSDRYINRHIVSDDRRENFRSNLIIWIFYFASHSSKKKLINFPSRHNKTKNYEKDKEKKREREERNKFQSGDIVNED